MNIIQVKKLSENARIPVKGSAGAAAYDLFSAVNVIIAPHSRMPIKTDIAVQMMSATKFYLRIAPRSSLASKGIDVAAGVVDEDYRGNITVIMVNTNDSSFVVNPGDKIAQMIVEQIVDTSITEVMELGETARGAGGFGSTDEKL
jgi:dUTP pyrophosphatase